MELATLLINLARSPKSMDEVNRLYLHLRAREA